jgi:hypothetical protein
VVLAVGVTLAEASAEEVAERPIHLRSLKHWKRTKG